MAGCNYLLCVGLCGGLLPKEYWTFEIFFSIFFFCIFCFSSSRIIWEGGGHPRGSRNQLLLYTHTKPPLVFGECFVCIPTHWLLMSLYIFLLLLLSVWVYHFPFDLCTCVCVCLVTYIRLLKWLGRREMKMLGAMFDSPSVGGHTAPPGINYKALSRVCLCACAVAVCGSIQVLDSIHPLYSTYIWPSDDGAHPSIFSLYKYRCASIRGNDDPALWRRRLIRWWLGQKNRNHNHHNNNKVFDGLDWATRHNLTEPRRIVL